MLSDAILYVESPQDEAGVTLGLFSYQGRMCVQTLWPLLLSTSSFGFPGWSIDYLCHLTILTPRRCLRTCRRASSNVKWIHELPWKGEGPGRFSVVQQFSLFLG